MAYITKGAFVIDEKGTTIEPGTEVTAKKLKCAKEDFARFIGLGLIEERVVKRAPAPADDGDAGSAGDAGDNTTEGGNA